MNIPPFIFQMAVRSQGCWGCKLGNTLDGWPVHPRAQI